MANAYTQCSLYLQPDANNKNTWNPKLLVAQLRHIDLIASPVTDSIAREISDYYTGEKFLDYIAYMGCAPNIQFEASPENENFCAIKIHQYQTSKLIISKTQSRPPQCPKCNKPNKNWRDTIKQTTLLCEHCQIDLNIDQYNWRKMAGYAATFIEITDIFPKEAIPQPLLLDALNKATGINWTYFYACQ